MGGFERKSTLLNLLGVQDTALHHFELPGRQRGPWRAFLQRCLFSFSMTVFLDTWTSSVVDGKYLVLPFFFVLFRFSYFFRAQGFLVFSKFLFGTL